MNIVGVGAAEQRVIHTEVTGGYDYDLTPIAPTPEDGTALLTSAGAEAAEPAVREAAFRSFLRVQNPLIYAPEALPCAGCHIATFVSAHTRATFALADEDFAEDAFVSSHDTSLRGGAAAEASSLRAFGWFDRTPMISQRVVNDSAVTVDDLDTRFPAQ